MLGILPENWVEIDSIVLLKKDLNPENFSWYLSSDSDEDGVNDFAERIEFFKSQRQEGAELLGSQEYSWSYELTEERDYMLKLSGTAYLFQGLGGEKTFENFINLNEWDSCGSFLLAERNFTDRNFNSTEKAELTLTLPEKVEPGKAFNLSLKNTGEAKAENITIFVLNREGNRGKLVNLSKGLAPGEEKTVEIQVEGLESGDDLRVTAVGEKGVQPDTSLVPVCDELLNFTELDFEEVTGRNWLKVKGRVPGAE